MFRAGRVAAIVAGLTVAAAGAARSQDVPSTPARVDPALLAAGATQFKSVCAFCHDGNSAPSLAGVVGRKIAATGYPSHSDALRTKGETETWTEANLDTFLAAPDSFAPGTLMTVNVPAAADRQAIIAYLKSLK
jgi:cytochrome c